MLLKRGRRAGAAELGTFLPGVDASTPERELRCRAALASTFVAGLELAREGALQLDQHRRSEAVIVRNATVPDPICFGANSPLHAAEQRTGPVQGDAIVSDAQNGRPPSATTRRPVPALDVMEVASAWV